MNDRGGKAMQQELHATRADRSITRDVTSIARCPDGTPKRNMRL